MKLVILIRDRIQDIYDLTENFELECKKVSLVYQECRSDVFELRDGKFVENTSNHRELKFQEFKKFVDGFHKALKFNSDLIVLKFSGLCYLEDCKKDRTEYFKKFFNELLQYDFVLDPFKNFDYYNSNKIDGYSVGKLECLRRAFETGDDRFVDFHFTSDWAKLGKDDVIDLISNISYDNALKATKYFYVD